MNPSASAPNLDDALGVLKLDNSPWAGVGMLGGGGANWTPAVPAPPMATSSEKGQKQKN